MIEENYVKLVLVRLETMPDYIEVNLGSFGTLSKDELIEHVKSQDSLGQKIVEKQMAYLKELKNL